MHFERFETTLALPWRRLKDLEIFCICLALFRPESCLFGDLAMIEAVDLFC
jgi:hypothetical protein